MCCSIIGKISFNITGLTVKDLKVVVNKLAKVKSKWHSIGLQLGVPHHELKAIENNYSTVERRLSEIVEFWLKGTVHICSMCVTCVPLT